MSKERNCAEAGGVKRRCRKGCHYT